MIDKKVKEFLTEIGRKGGSVTSEKKRAACAKNWKKALLAKEKKRLANKAAL